MITSQGGDALRRGDGRHHAAQVAGEGLQNYIIDMLYICKTI